MAAKDRLHELVGVFAGWILSQFGVSGAARDFADELAANIPILPVDAKVIAVARGVQVTGILLCVVREIDLTQCECFIDLALEETKTRVRKILIAAMGDWTGLVSFPPKEVRPAA